MTNVNVIVMGYSGSGKDTAYRYLASKYPGLAHNVKFPTLAKQRLAAYMQVPVSFMEDREWRTKTYVPGTDRTVLQFLIDTYHVFRVLEPDHWPAKVLSDLPQGIRVFTDVRSPAEATQIMSKLDPAHTFLLWVHRDGARIESSDTYQAEIAEKLEAWLPGWHSQQVWNNGSVYDFHSRLETVLAYLDQYDPQNVKVA